QHFIHFSGANTPKNKLQDAVYRLLHTISDHLIDDLDLFKNCISNAIVKLNRIHHKCSPLELSFYDAEDGATGLFVGSNYVVRCYIYPVTGQFEVHFPTLNLNLNSDGSISKTINTVECAAP